MTGIDLYSFRALWQHYRARRHKRNTFNALAFEIDAEANHLALERELRMHAYRPARSICFISEGPKPREVFAADFRDRVVHHLLVSQLEKLYEPRFIHDSYACRKGGHACRQRSANGVSLPRVGNRTSQAAPYVASPEQSVTC